MRGRGAGAVDGTGVVERAGAADGTGGADGTGVPAQVDGAIAALAAGQHGYVTRAQLLELGLSDHGIGYRAGISRLIPVYAGVYAVGHAALAARFETVRVTWARLTLKPDREAARLHAILADRRDSLGVS